MRPAVKYAATMTLYHAGAEGVWEYDLFDRLTRHYPQAQLSSLREDLVGMSTLGWLDTLEEREYRGNILRRYAMRDDVRPFLEYQLDVAKFAHLAAE